MASSARIVAELGRPETPQETADRKAAASAAYRSSKTFRNLIAALLVTVALVAIVYFGVPRGSFDEAQPADVAAAAAQVAASTGRTIIVPTVPSDWRANKASLEGQTWRVVYAPSATTGYVNVAQGIDAPDGWASKQLGNYAPTGSVTIHGIEWDEYEIPAAARTDTVSYALSSSAGTDTVLIYGDTDAATAAIAAEGVADQIRALREETP